METMERVAKTERSMRLKTEIVDGGIVTQTEDHFLSTDVQTDMVRLDEVRVM